jgi:hypothetical protein
MATTDIETPALEFFKIQKLGTFITGFFQFVLVISAIMAMAYLIWGGINWMMSEGDKAKYEEARNRITAAIIGLAIIASVWVLWRLVLYFLGIGEIVDGQVIFTLLPESGSSSQSGPTPIPTTGSSYEPI